MILLTGVVLWRLCRLYKKTKMYKNRRKITATTLHKRAARAKIDFCAPGRDLASILAAPERSRVLPDAPPGVPGRSWGSPGRSRGVLGAPRDASKTLLGCLPNALGHHGASREGRGIDFESILGAPGQLRPAPGTELGSIFGSSMRPTGSVISISQLDQPRNCSTGFVELGGFGKQRPASSIGNDQLELPARPATTSQLDVDANLPNYRDWVACKCQHRWCQLDQPSQSASSTSRLHRPGAIRLARSQPAR